MSRSGGELEASRTSNLYSDRNLVIVFGVTLMGVLGVASITPAFPVIGPALGFDYPYVELGLLVTVFTVPAVVLSPVYGVLSDSYGRKKILTPSLFLFGLAGFLCSFFPNFTVLLALRFLQGAGASALGVLNVTIISDLYSGKERISALGYNSSVLGLGTGSWPLIGGALGTLAWYAPFMLPLIAIPIGLLVIFFLDSPESRYQQEAKAYFKEVWLIIKQPKVIVIFTAGIINFFIIYGVWVTYVPSYLSGYFGLIPLYIGVIQSAASYVGAAVSTRVGKLARQYSEWSILKVTYILYAIGVIIIPFIPVIWLISLPVLLLGLALGLNGPIIQAMIAEEATINQRGVILSMLGMMLRIGQTLGPMVMIIVASIFGFNSIFIAGAVFALLMFLILFLLPHQGVKKAR